MFKLTKTACKMSLRRPPEVVLRCAIAKEACRRVGISPCLTSARTHVHKAAVCTELGKPLQIRTDIPTPQSLEKGQVLIAVQAVGINFADVLLCAGLYQEKPPLPFIPGSEISGEVAAVGEGVTDLAINDRVLALSRLSGFSEFCVIDSKAVWKMPETLAYPEAAALLVSYGTAFMALTRTAQVKPGETILVTAAAGALGLAAVDLGVNTFGCNVIAACGGEEKGLLVKEKGAHHVIDYTKEDMRQRVKEITEGRGANVIIDPVGGQVFMDCIRSVAFEGRIVTLGYASGDIPKVPANHLLVKSCSVMGLYWGSYSKLHPEAHAHSIASILRLSREGKVSPHVSKVFPLEQANEALRFLHSRKSTGKVCLQVGKD